MAAAAMAAAACNNPAEPEGEANQTPGTFVSADVEREPAPDVSLEARARLIDDKTSFALDVYHRLREKEANLFFSPFSVSLTLAMIYGGARSETEAQMAQAAHFGLSQETLHPAFNWLESTLEGQDEGSEGFRLSIVNATFGQEGQELLPSYLDLLARNYGAGMALLDFSNEPEDARLAINDWVADQTKDRIPSLLPEGSVSSMTVLVLVNAIYFKAGWHTPFRSNRTAAGVFHAAGGDVTVPMMNGEPKLASYVQGDGFQAVSLPYRGEACEMVIIMPDEGRFEEIESRLDGALLATMLGSLEHTRISVTMPRFEIRTRVTMNDLLQELGMRDAFTSAADFSGINGRRDLYLSLVQHEAFVHVDENGTEATAATAGGIDLVSLPQPVIIDRPFLFLIRDVETRSILFLGRVMNPA
jgi:serpin B